MNDSKQRYLVSGSSALKPDCSRHSNENEHIINFPAQTIITYDMPRRPSVRNRKPLQQRIVSEFARTDMVRDLRKGSIKGTPFGKASKRSLAAAGMVYTILGIAILYFGG